MANGTQTACLLPRMMGQEKQSPDTSGGSFATLPPRGNGHNIKRPMHAYTYFVGDVLKLKHRPLSGVHKLPDVAQLGESIHKCKENIYSFLTAFPGFEHHRLGFLFFAMK